MNILSHRGTILTLRLYTAGALIATGLISPPALSIAVFLVLFAQLFFWWRRSYNNIHIMLVYYIFFVIAVLFSQKVDPLLSPLFSIPVLLLLDHDLKESSRLMTPIPIEQKYKATPLGLTLLISTVVALVLGIALGNASLSVGSLIGLAYFSIIGTIVIRNTNSQVVRVEQLTLSVVAGSHYTYRLALTPLTTICSQFSLFPPFEWVKVHEPQFIINRKESLVSEITITPPLSGPTIIRLNGTILDQWGLIQKSFYVEPYRLNVTPRARYAEWLAKKYLTETKSGSLPLISTISSIKPLYGLRRGIEYYGSRLYQPGDSLKNIDWKHSSKYNKLISKEFIDFHGQQAILLVNLVVGDAEEADKQAFNIVTTALSLAKEQIPSAIAAYDDKGSIILTTTLPPGQLVMRALETITKIIIIKNPVKYLGHADIIRLRSNINRLQSTTIDSTKILTELLQIEYNNLKNISKTNPATLTLNAAINKVGQQTTIVILSQSNHDIEAIEFAIYAAFNKGNAVIKV